jgi:hypothetical protein
VVIFGSIKTLLVWKSRSWTALGGTLSKMDFDVEG